MDAFKDSNEYERDLQDLADVVRMLRKLSEMPMREFAVKSYNIPFYHISDLENKRKKGLNYSTVSKICSAHGYSISEAFNKLKESRS